MQSPANARHLRESIAQLRHGNLEEHDLIDIPDEDAEKLRTVGDALGYLNQKVGA